jgi:hypothetical protein
MSGNKTFFQMLGNLESRLLGPWLKEVTVDKPIYICGLARAGTTVTLRILGKHPQVTAHRFMDQKMVYLPYTWDRFSSLLPISSPVERGNKDGIMNTNRSPTAIEEMLWMKFFDHLHDETRSNVLDGQVSNPTFEKFYCDHLKKLLLSRGRSRYITKNNYNVTRLAYLQKIFPDVKFLIMIRNPVNHVASLIRQNRIFVDRGQQDPKRNASMLKRGHFEFGEHRQCINTGNIEIVHEVWRLWQQEQPIRAWATYWSSIYDFLADQLTNPSLAKASLVIKHEELCTSPGGTLDRIIAHMELSPEIFASIRESAIKKLNFPNYYQSNFSSQELNDIAELTHATAERFEYSLNSHHSSWSDVSD